MHVRGGSLRLRWSGLAAVLVVAGLAVAGGCMSSSADSDDPTTRALGDPMHYSAPDPGYDITGGGTADFDKDAFNRDMDHVLNP